MGAETLLGEIERRVTGHLTVCQGIRQGDYYTIYGTVSSITRKR
jgi:hypothetical protein